MSNMIMQNLRNSAQEIRNRGLITDEEYEKLLSEVEVEDSEESEEPAEVYTCPECGCVVDPEDLDVYEIDGDFYCRECTAQCDFCGEHIRYEESVIANLDIMWAHEYTACERCADRRFVECDACGRQLYGRAIAMQDNHRAICTNCESDYYTCCDCGEIIHVDSAFYRSNVDDWYCEDCYPGDCDSPYVNSYDNEQLDPDYSYHRRRFRKMSDEITDLYFGIEQETDDGYDRRSYAEELYRISDDGRLFSMKDDGSLSDNGVEIVSCPCSYRYMMEEYPYDRIWRIAESYGYKAHDTQTCGLHIHVSRAGLAEDVWEQELVIAKLMLLFERFWDNVVRFSRRDMYQMANYARKLDVGFEPSDDPLNLVRKSKTVCGRYVAINTTNPHTVEFRVFKGTLNTRTVKASIQFVKHLVEFCQTNPLEKVQSVSWNELMDTHYEELSEYLETRSLR